MLSRNVLPQSYSSFCRLVVQSVRGLSSAPAPRDDISNIKPRIVTAANLDQARHLRKLAKRSDLNSEMTDPHTIAVSGEEANMDRFEEMRKAAFRNWTVKYLVSKYNCIPNRDDFMAAGAMDKAYYRVDKGNGVTRCYGFPAANVTATAQAIRNVNGTTDNTTSRILRHVANIHTKYPSCFCWVLARKSLCFNAMATELSITTTNTDDATKFMSELALSLSTESEFSRLVDILHHMISAGLYHQKKYVTLEVHHDPEFNHFTTVTVDQTTPNSIQPKSRGEGLYILTLQGLSRDLMAAIASGQSLLKDVDVSVSEAEGTATLIANYSKKSLIKRWLRDSARFPKLITDTPLLIPTKSFQERIFVHDSMQHHKGVTGITGVEKLKNTVKVVTSAAQARHAKAYFEELLPTFSVAHISVPYHVFPFVKNNMFFEFFVSDNVLAYVNKHSRSVTFCGGSNVAVSREAKEFVKHLDIVEKQFYLAAQIVWKDRKKLQFLGFYLRERYEATNIVKEAEGGYMLTAYVPGIQSVDKVKVEFNEEDITENAVPLDSGLVLNGIGNLRHHIFVDETGAPIPVFIDFTSNKHQITFLGFTEDVVRATQIMESLIENNNIKHFQFKNSRLLSKFVGLDGNGINSVARRYPQVHYNVMPPKNILLVGPSQQIEDFSEEMMQFKTDAKSKNAVKKQFNSMMNEFLF